MPTITDLLGFLDYAASLISLLITIFWLVDKISLDYLIICLIIDAIIFSPTFACHAEFRHYLDVNYHFINVCTIDWLVDAITPLILADWLMSLRHAHHFISRLITDWLIDFHAHAFDYHLFQYFSPRLLPAHERMLVRWFHHHHHFSASGLRCAACHHFRHYKTQNLFSFHCWSMAQCGRMGNGHECRQ